MPEYADPPPEAVAELRAVCLGLPETYEETAWVGTRWMVRRRNFAHVLSIDSGDGPTAILTFRSQGPELEVLRRVGHPFFRLGWGRDVMGMVLDDATDWDEVAEIVTESYCVLAPKKLAAQVDRPDTADS